MRVHPASALTRYKVTTTVEVLNVRLEHIIGVAYPHTDGEGFNIFLFSRPFGDCLTLRLDIREYGPMDGRSLLPVDWPPDNVGTTFDPWPHGKGKKKTPRRRLNLELLGDGQLHSNHINPPKNS